MKWSIISVGKPAFSWIREGTQEYLGRLKRYSQVECRALACAPAQVAARMLEDSEGAFRIVLDEKGKSLTSQGFAEWIERHQMEGIKRVSVLIGGAEGHSAEVRGAAREVWALSALTLQHELALLLFMEQLYRAYTILKGEPYHRA